MTSITEAVGQQSPIESALRAGLRAIDRNQTVTFTQYNRTVLPTDGYIFWVATTNTVTVNGSVHYGTDVEQNEDETIAINQIIFTAETQIQQFNNVNPNTIWIGTFDGLQFAFSQQGDFYQQADLWHYVGNAVYPALSSQLVSSAAALSSLEPIITNSLPLWLSLNAYGTVYPSFLVPENIAPPYIVAHIGEEDTEALAPLPIWGWSTTPATTSGIQAATNTALADQSGNIIAASNGTYQASSQLMQDKVRLTLYGFNNTQAMSYRDYLFQNSINTDNFGLCGAQAAIKDAKRTQREIAVIAQKKIIDLTISYYQSTINNIAQRLILAASCSFTVGA